MAWSWCPAPELADGSNQQGVIDMAGLKLCMCTAELIDIRNSEPFFSETLPKSPRASRQHESFEALWSVT